MRTKAQALNGQTLLARVNGGKSAATYTPRKAVYRQGDPADSIYFVAKGKVKLTVLSRRGKEAVIGILGAGDFFGEQCLAGQVLRTAAVIPLAECRIVRIDKVSAIRALRDDPEFSAQFLAYVLSRNLQIQEDLVDQLFNSSEKRLARVLLQLANFGKESPPDRVIAKVSQQMLAEMIGTTRSRVNYFMNKFRKLGFIEYNGALEVRSSLLRVVLHD